MGDSEFESLCYEKGYVDLWWIALIRHELINAVKVRIQNSLLYSISNLIKST